jgi:hypothetical protein
MIHYYSSNSEEKEFHLQSVKPEAIAFINARVDLILEGKANVYPTYVRGEDFLRSF